MSQQPQIVELETKRLVGLSQTMSRSADRTGELWGRFMPRRAEIANRSGQGFISMQVFPRGPAQIADPEAEFTKWAVVEVDAFTSVPAGMSTYTLAGGQYAVFEHHGPATDISTFLYIFQQWLPASDYRLADREHFEQLPEGYNPRDPNAHELIWIPIEQR